MRQLVIGTTNRGKVRQVAGALSSLPDLECVPIDLVSQDLPVVVELGESAEQVAAVKAIAYSAAIGEPVLSLDHWLRFSEASTDAVGPPWGTRYQRSRIPRRQPREPAASL